MLRLFPCSEVVVFVCSLFDMNLNVRVRDLIELGIFGYNQQRIFA